MDDNQGPDPDSFSRESPQDPAGPTPRAGSSPDAPADSPPDDDVGSQGGPDPWSSLAQHLGATPAPDAELTARDWKTRTVEFYRPKRGLTRFSIPLIFHYEREEDRSELSLPLGLFKRERLGNKSSYRILWLISFDIGSSDDLLEIGG